MIVAQIDPIAWKTELERVAPKLKAQMIMLAGNHEWRSHVDQTVNTKANIEKLMGDNSSDLTAINK
jgi:hypothetical protein